MVAAVGGALLLAATAGATVMLLAFRGRVPAALRAVRRFNREVTNVSPRRTAGRAGSGTALLRHRGRVSGASYATPLGATRVADGFEIALPYGRDTDWLRNLRAAGWAVLEVGGVAHRVDDPRIVPIASAQVATTDARTIRVFGIREAVRVRSTPISVMR